MIETFEWEDFLNVAPPKSFDNVDSVEKISPRPINKSNKKQPQEAPPRSQSHQSQRQSSLHMKKLYTISGEKILKEYSKYNKSHPPSRIECIRLLLFWFRELEAEKQDGLKKLKNLLNENEQLKRQLYRGE